MELKYIREFLEIAKCSNFLESADNLEMSQSALSKHIQALEKDLKTELFKRTTRKVFLSESGKIFLPYAEQLYEIYRDMQRQLKEFVAKDRMRLSICCSPLMGNYGIMQDISDFKKKNPEADFHLVEYNNYIGNDIGKSLIDFEYDLAFCNPCNLNLNMDRFETLEYCVDHLVALLPADHPLSAVKEINLSLLAQEKLLLMDYSTPIHDLCYSLFHKVGFEPNVHFSGVRIENFIEMVSNKMGIAILLKKHITSVNKNCAIVREITPTAKSTISFARVRNRRHSTISKLFWNFIKEQKKASENTSQIKG